MTSIPFSSSDGSFIAARYEKSGVCGARRPHDDGICVRVSQWRGLILFKRQRAVNGMQLRSSNLKIAQGIRPIS